jgi:tetratricopeptide (TPR) repeat protein
MFHLRKHKRAELGRIALKPIMLYFLLSSSQIGAQTIGDELNSPVEAFLKGTDIMRMEASLEQHKCRLETIEDPIQRYAYMAQLCFIQGVLEESKSNPEAAFERFEEAQRFAEQSLAFGETSAAYRILADAYTQQMKYRGLLYQLANGSKIRKYAQSALNLDPENVKAQLTLALYFFHAPPTAGGGIEKSMDLLHRIETHSRLYPIDRYSILIWLAIGYQNQDDITQAEHYLEAALRLYPHNVWIDNLLRSHNL